MRPTESTIDESEILDLLTALVDKSLVVYDESTGRYRLLDTVRQYGRDRIVESGDLDARRDLHLAHFLVVAEEAEPHLRGAQQQAWLARLENEHDNLRAALAWSSEGARDLERGLRLAGAVWRFWEIRGYLGEGRGWIGNLLAGSVDGIAGSVRAKSLNGAGELAYRQADYSAARELHEQSLAIRRTLGDLRGIAASLNNLGYLAYDQCDYPAARALIGESLDISQTLGDRTGIAVSLNSMGDVAHRLADYPAARDLYAQSLSIRRELSDQRGIAHLLGNLGSVAYEQSDYEAARSLHEESRAIKQELGDRWGIAASLNNLGNVAYGLGEYLTARALQKESLAIMRDLGDRHNIASALEGLAPVVAALETPVKAATLWGSVQRLRTDIGSPLPPNERPRYEVHVAAARAALGDDAKFEAAWREGRAMTMDRAIEYALSEADERA